MRRKPTAGEKFVVFSALSQGVVNDQMAERLPAWIRLRNWSGVVPVALRKAAVKLDWDEKPRLFAMSAMHISE